MAAEPADLPSAILPIVGLFGLAAVTGAFLLLLIGPKEARMSSMPAAPAQQAQPAEPTQQPAQPSAS